MVSIISYNKQTWNEYDDNQTADENLANGAIISADRLNNMETGISNNDTNKVTDNKDGTEQINNVKVSPFNKLTDTVGGVNYIKDGNFLKFTPNWSFQGTPDITEIISDDTSGKNYYHWRVTSGRPYIGPSQAIQQAFSQGDQLTLTLIAHADQATNMSIFIHEQDASGNIVANSGLNVAHSGNYNHDVNLTATDSLITWHWTIQNDCNSLWLQFSNYQTLTNDYYITNAQLEKGSIATDWAPAPEDKVTDNHDGTEQLNGVQVQPFNKLSDTICGRNLYLNSKAITDGYGINGSATVTVEPFDSTTNMWHIVSEKGIGMNIGIYLINYAIGKLPDTSDWSFSVDMKGTGDVHQLGMEDGDKNPIIGTVGSDWSRISETGHLDNSDDKTLIIYFDSTNSPVDVYIKLPKLEQGSAVADWTPAPEDKVNVSDMRKPASDVAGIEEVNAKQDKIGYTPADDSKVAHLSGDNNFDTVPTYGTNDKPFAINDTGETTARPTGQAVGYQYFDTTLNKPIWYNGANWVDSTGTTV